MKIRNFKTMASLFLATGLFFASCSSDNEDDGNPVHGQMAQVSLKAKADYNGASAKGMALAAAKANLEIAGFLVNISEIELEFDDDFMGDDDDDGFYGHDDDGYFDFDDDLELKGPFELDLVSNEFTFAVVDLPQAQFEELEFKFQKNRDENSALYGKTVLVHGTLEGMPFEFWHNFEEDAEIDFEDSNKDIIISSDNREIIINFNLDGLLASIDLSTAVDGNGDGLIEISPVDTDGNTLLARQIREQIKDFIDLLDD